MPQGEINFCPLKAKYSIQGNYKTYSDICDQNKSQNKRNKILKTQK